MYADLVFTGFLNGLMSGGVYILVAMGLTLIYGVLHIINFAHGAMLMVAMYATFFLWTNAKIDPYVALPFMATGGFAIGYLLHRFVVRPSTHGNDNNVLLVTLGISIVLENLALAFFGTELRIATLPYADTMVPIGPALLPLTKIVSFLAAVVICAAFAVLMSTTMMGKAIRAVAKEKQGARLAGIEVDHIYAVSFGMGIACLGAAACLMIPNTFVSASSGISLVLIAFTIVVLGGMGSFVGALIGGLIIGIVESLGGLLFGEHVGQLSISLIFILILLFRPTGLFRGAQ